MKISLTTKNGVTIEAEGATHTEVFKQLAQLQEVFDVGECGKCGQNHLRYVVRNVNDNDFFEIHCLGCHSRFEYGQHKKGDTLFPKRKDKAGEWLKSNGWGRYDKNKGETVYD